MSNLQENPEWVDGIYQLTEETPVLGKQDGVSGDGPSNLQAQQLANRTRFLYDLLLILQQMAYSSAQIYSDVAEGLSGTQDGDYFRVLVGSNTDYTYAVYKNVSGEAIFTAYDSLNINVISRIEELISSVVSTNASESNDTDFSAISEVIMDALGNAVFQRHSDGTSQFPAIMIGKQIEFVQLNDGGVVCQHRDTQQEILRLSGSGGLINGDLVMSLSDDDTDISEVILDALGNAIYQRHSDGTFQFAALRIGENIDAYQDSSGALHIRNRATGGDVISVNTNGLMMLGSLSFFESDEFPGYSEIYMDNSGRIYKRVKEDGTVEMAGDGGDRSTLPVVAAVDGNIIAVSDGIITPITQDSNVSNISPVAYSGFARWLSNLDGSYKTHRASFDAQRRVRESKRTLIHLIVTGQSLAGGGSTQTQSPVTTSPQADYGVVAFATGPKVDFKYDALDAALLTSLIQCAENVGTRPNQESPASGIAWQIHQLTGHTVLATTANSSGTAISGISSGTAAFAGATAMIKAAVELANELEMDYQPVLVLIHGNQDAAAGTAAATYITRMETLRSEYESVVNDQAGINNLKMFIGQLANIIPYGGTSGTEKTNVIGIAQYQAARDNENMVLASTEYARPYSDGEHLTSAGYRTEGEIIGLAIGSWLLDNAWSALVPDEANITQTGLLITIPLKGCVGTLVIDTTRVTDPGNYGFTLTGATIAMVAVSGSDADAKIIITKTDESVATAVAYAATGIAGQNPGPNTGSRGCIHDSRAGESLSGLPLYNDLAVFSVSL